MQYTNTLSLSSDRQSRKVKTSVALRKLFPRPAFLPEKIEIGLEKHVLIDSPDTPTYELVRSDLSNIVSNPVFGYMTRSNTNWAIQP